MKKKANFTYDNLNPGPEYYADIATWNDSLGKNSAFYPHEFIETARTGTTSVVHVHYKMLAIEMVLEGALTFFRNNKKIRVNANEVFLCIPGETSGFYTQPKDWYKKLTLIISGTITDLLIHTLHLNESMKITLRNPSVVEQRLREIKALLREKKPGTEILISERGMGLLLLLSQEHDFGDQKIPAELHLALEYLHANYTKRNVPISELADSAGVSTSTLRRLFSKYYNQSPVEYVLRMRMELAKDLLLNSSLSIKNIADKTGFREYFYFSSTFRRFTGLSPKIYRETFAKK